MSKSWDQPALTWAAALRLSSIFMKKHMIYADTVRLGGDHVTRDISMGFQVPIATAERIKTRSGD